ncbi:MAG: autotransporter-associated beta strand repeat-containing protein, partial [Pirellulales bacterium]|nr:autotransporter-associated beta strand repeat-containing protein [Pirellulales bacterium]
MDFSAVTTPLTIRLGSVSVTDGTATATHADDEFIMTGPLVSFAGSLDGGGGSNSLTYRWATGAIVEAVDTGGTPNVGSVQNIATVTAVPAVTIIDIDVPLGGELIDTTIRGGDDRIVKKGPGRLVLSLANSHSGGTVVEEGEVVIRDPAALGSGGLEVLAGARVTLDVGFGTVSLASLSLASGGFIDLDTGRLAIAGGSDEATLRQWIIAARGTGSWGGTSGLG